MNQSKFYKLIAFGLLALNLSMIAFFFLTKPGHPGPPHEDPKNFQAEVVEILDLNDQQASTFMELANAHGVAMESMYEEQKELLSVYFTTDTMDTRALTLSRFQQLEGEKVKFTNQHLLDIKNILKDSQLPHFEGFKKVFLDKIILKEKNNSPPPKDF